VDWADEQEQSRDRIWKAYLDDLPVLAVALGREHVRRYPMDSEGWLELASPLMELRRLREARAALHRAAEFADADELPRVFDRMGELYDAQGRLSSAVHWYRRALEADPAECCRHVTLGRALAKCGRWHEAQESLRAATSASAGDITEAWCELGLLFVTLERLEEAQACFSRVLDQRPGYAKALSALKDVELVLQRRNSPERKDGLR